MATIVLQSLNPNSKRILRPNIQLQRAYSCYRHGDHFMDTYFETAVPVLKILKQSYSYDFIRLSKKNSNVYKIYLVIKLYRFNVQVFFLEKMTICWHMFLSHIFFFLDSNSFLPYFHETFKLQFKDDSTKFNLFLQNYVEWKMFCQ